MKIVLAEFTAVGQAQKYLVVFSEKQTLDRIIVNRIGSVNDTRRNANLTAIGLDATKIIFDISDIVNYGCDKFIVEVNVVCDYKIAHTVRPEMNHQIFQLVIINIFSIYD